MNSISYRSCFTPATLTEGFKNKLENHCLSIQIKQINLKPSTIDVQAIVQSVFDSLSDDENFFNDTFSPVIDPNSNEEEWN